MPHPTILVLSQILTSTVSTDSSVAEFLRRQATFLEDDTLPADLKERGAAIFHHALFTETPNAIRAGDTVVEVLRRTIIAVGGLYLGMERGMQDEGTRIEGTSMHTAHKQTREVDDKNGVAHLSVQPKRKRTQKDSDGDPESDSTSSHVRDAESKAIRKVIAIRPGRRVIVPRDPQSEKRPGTHPPSLPQEPQSLRRCTRTPTHRRPSLHPSSTLHLPPRRPHTMPAVPQRSPPLSTAPAAPAHHTAPEPSQSLTRSAVPSSSPSSHPPSFLLVLKHVSLPLLQSPRVSWLF
jgi:hypothetical protein